MLKIINLYNLLLKKLLLKLEINFFIIFNKNKFKNDISY